MADTDDIMELVRANGHVLWLAGPQSATAISDLDAFFGVTLPPSYRDFLIRFGGAAIYDSTISGILDGDTLTDESGWIYGDTLRFREEWDLPKHLLIIQPNEDAPFCLDTSTSDRNGEFPMVCFELHSKTYSEIASDFGTWFRRDFLGTWVERNA